MQESRKSVPNTALYHSSSLFLRRSAMPYSLSVITGPLYLVRHGTDRPPSVSRYLYGAQTFRGQSAALSLTSTFLDDISTNCHAGRLPIHSQAHLIGSARILPTRSHAPLMSFIEDHPLLQYCTSPCTQCMQSYDDGASSSGHHQLPVCKFSF